MEQQPNILEGIDGERERAAVLGRLAVLEELDLGLSDFMTRKIARLELTERARSGNLLHLSFHQSIAKARVGMYGDLKGLNYADVEITAEQLGVFDTIYGSVLEESEADTAK